jgi:hypothetical protein
VKQSKKEDKTMSSQYPYNPPQGYPPQYQQPQPAESQPPADPSLPAGEGEKVIPDAADQEFWDKAVLAAIGGISGECRLTSDAIVAKAAACAQQMVKYRKAYIKGETPEQLAEQKDAADKKKGEEAQKKQQDELKAQQQKTDEEAKKRQDQLKKNQDAQLAPPPEGLITTMVPPQSGPVSDYLATTQPKPPQQPAA